VSLRHRATIIPLVFFLCGAIGIVLLYRTIKSAEQQRLRLETGITAEQVRLRLEAWIDSRAALVAHLAERQFADSADIDRDFARQAQTFIDLYPGFQALNFVDRQWVIRIIVPAVSNAPALGKDLHNHPSAGVVSAMAKAAAQQHVTRTPIIDLLQGGKGIATYCPLLDRRGKWLGFVNGVFRVRELIDSCLYESVLHERFSYRLTNSAGDIAYQRESESAPATGRFGVVVPVRIVDNNWNLHLCPTPAYTAQSRTMADELMAGTGIGLLIFLALVLRMLLVRQEILRESQAKYRLLVENQIDMVVKLDPAGNFLYVSPSYCEAFNRSEEELLGSNFLPLVHPDDRDHTQAALTSLHNPPHRSYNEQRSLAGDGIVWQSWSNVAVLDSDGNLAAITAVGRDITRRRELEDQLNLSRKMQAVGQLAGGIAHDFNNLLQSMLGNLQFVVEDTHPTGQTAEDLQEIERGISKAMTLTRQLLAFGRKQDLQPKREDLNHVVAGALEQLRRNMRTTITLEFEPADQPVIVRVDRGQAEQIIHNLCDNAHDALDSTGTIRLTTAVRTIDAAFCEKYPDIKPGDYAVLVIADDGHGMSPEVLERAFEPFFTTREVGAGTGLGLATIFGIVQQHRGTILAESTVNKGSTFTVLLPLEKGEHLPSPRVAPPPATTANETILLAEDNSSVRELAVRVLERADYKVLVAEDGQQAIDVFAAKQATVDLVILDMIMPRVGGYKACEAILAMRPEVPILFASGYDPTSIVDNGKLPEGAEILMKPYGIPDLLRKVREVIDRGKLPEQPVS